MFCPKCGTKVSPDTEICPHCGQRLLSKAKSAESNKATASKQASTGKKWLRKHSKKYNYLIGGLILVVIVLIGYWTVFVPQRVNGLMKNAAFTTQNQYTVKTNALNRTIVITASTSRIGDIQSALDADHFDTSKLAVEEQLATVAKELPSKLFGTWTLQLEQHTYKDTDTVLWKFKGATETKRYQNTVACRQAHQQYLEKEAEQQSEDASTSKAAGLAGGLLGWGLMR